MQAKEPFVPANRGAPTVVARSRLAAVGLLLGSLGVLLQCVGVVALRSYRAGSFGPWDGYMTVAIPAAVVAGLVAIVCGAMSWRAKGWQAVLVGLVSVLVMPLILFVNMAGEDVL